MIPKQFLFIALFLVQLLFSSFNVANDIDGRVVAVKDGDTIEVLTAKKELYVIRLNDIDCPEKKQAFGQKAKEFTANFCFGKMVKVVWLKQDRYKRILGYVYTSNGGNLNFELVKNGLAWRYKYSRNKDIKALEERAKEQKLGLWSNQDAIAPWDFRKMKIKPQSALQL